MFHIVQMEEIDTSLEVSVSVAGLSKTYGASFFKKLFDCKFVRVAQINSTIVITYRERNPRKLRWII